MVIPIKIDPRDIKGNNKDNYKAGQTNIWVFNLLEEKDPFVLACIVGLHRVLSQAHNSVVHTNLVQTPTCTWVLTETTITITFLTLEDLNAIVREMLGDFTRGIAIIPGYPTDPMQYNFRISVDAHRASIHNIFKPAKRGPQWAASTNPGAKKGKKSYLNAFIAANKGYFDQLLSFGKITPNAALPPINHPDRSLFPPNIALDATKPGTMAIRHPMYAMWYNQERCNTLKNQFLYTFAIAGHIYLGVNTVIPSEHKKIEQRTEYIALGIYADTFSQVDKWMDDWFDIQPLNISGPPQLALWIIAAFLKLHNTSYSVIDRINGGYYLFRPTQQEKFYSLMNQFVEGLTNEAGIVITRRVHYDPLLWPLLDNYFKGTVWYANVPKNINTIYYFEKRQENLQRLIEQIANTEEQELLKSLSNMIGSARIGIYRATENWSQADARIKVLMRKDLFVALYELLSYAIDEYRITENQFHWILSECNKGNESQIINLLRIASQLKYKEEEDASGSEDD